MLMAARVNWIVQTKLKPMICPSVLPSEACTELSNTDVAAGLSRRSSIPREARGRCARAASYFRHLTVALVRDI